ncbi:restriction endonuclease PLD domain-containing protein [Methanomethylophilus alvi]|uniref:restriction endonuclease PLD domain-containing protein n=1 Tax=Methanomethylophilus alvi TaxID=1291540 RepID=UPI0037DBF523
MKILSNLNPYPGTKGNELLYRILINPACECDELRIISGYTSSAMAKRHLDELNILEEKVRIELIYGMTPAQGVSRIEHSGFQKLMSENPNFSCSYLMINRLPCHVKMYVWLKQGVPVKAFIGSANYSQNAFYDVNESEAMCECDPKQANDFFERFSGDTVYCNHDEVEDIALITSKSSVKEQIKRETVSLAEANSSLHGNILRLSLLSSDGSMGTTSSLNWGQRGKRNRDEAYIPIQSKIGKEIVDNKYFPPKETVFLVLTDDGITLYMVLAGNKSDNPVAKQLETSHDNSVLGEYFRKRLGVPSGEYITKEMLLNYGRTYVDFINLGDGTYYMDFSVKPKTD